MTLIRATSPDDFAAIVQLNADEVQQTSEMDIHRLAELHGFSCHHKVAVVDGRVVGFLLAMFDSAPYLNDNFNWFANRYDSFVYVDRIVISKDFAGRRIGSALYRDLFDHARQYGKEFVVCEYNIEPPNEASAAFHRRWNFSEVGSQYVAGGAKKVSLQAAAVAINTQET